MKKSAGILLYRLKNGKPEFFLVHPGGPFFAHSDVWGIPKGEYKENENAFEAAKREFEEETGFNLPEGKFIELKPVTNKAGKEISAWAVEGDADPAKLKSNTFKLWGREFPEVDRGEWFDLETAKKKINQAQAAFLEELYQKLQK